MEIEKRSPNPQHPLSVPQIPTLRDCNSPSLLSQSRMLGDPEDEFEASPYFLQSDQSTLQPHPLAIV